MKKSRIMRFDCFEDRDACEHAQRNGVVSIVRVRNARYELRFSTSCVKAETAVRHFTWAAESYNELPIAEIAYHIDDGVNCHSVRCSSHDTPADLEENSAVTWDMLRDDNGNWTIWARFTVLGECPVCHDCGEYITDEPVVIGGETFCPDCADGWTTCDDCGEAVRDCDTVETDDGDGSAPAEELQEQIAPRLHVSARNSKLGRVPNMSLAPVRSCSACACRTCAHDGCYALKSYCQYPDTRRAWDDNTDLALHDLAAMERGFMEYFQRETTRNRRRPFRFFRIHVGGDFVSVDYARMWFRIALAFPAVKFLAFTKQWDVVRPVPFYTLPNFSLRLSDWPGTTIPDGLKKLYHIAYMDDGTRPADTFPAGALECPGNCETCGACWGFDGDTLFHKH